MSQIQWIKIWTKRNRNFVVDCLLMMPFALFFCYLILQDSSCNGQFFCYHSPDILKHSIIYDIFFLRAGLAPENSHLFSELLVPLLFFPLMFALKDVKRAFILSAFFPFWHEIIWTTVEHFYVGSNAGIYFGGLKLGEFLWIILTLLMSGLAIYVCKEILLTKVFLLMNLVNLEFLACWWVFDSMNVTVTAPVNGIILSPFYHQFLTNFFEVGDWITVYFVILITVIYFIYRHPNYNFKRIEVSR